MDNITHTLVGAALAEAGLKRRTPLAATALILGANLPDLDIVTGLFGTLPYLEHHRGLTHALAALPPLAALQAGALYLYARRRGGTPAEEVRPRASFGRLFTLSLLAILTHPLLDFTNSYGWRPFLPWSNRWYYGDTAFVIDPWIWLLLGGALCLATAKTRTRLILWAGYFATLSVPILLFKGTSIGPKLAWVVLAVSVIALRAVYSFGDGLAHRVSIVALGLLLAYFGARVVLHQAAVNQLRATAAEIVGTERIEQISALPQPFSPFEWQATLVTDNAYYLTELHLLSRSQSARVTRHARESGILSAIAAARQTAEIQTFLHFARFPVFEARPAQNQFIEVAVSDARFMDTSGRSRSTFRAVVHLDQNLQPVVEK